ncbi:hypothetical protein BASA81_016202 [Batrachochytrium salamandrivorans]|nr:hypothetical protein BASA81_016202 [Batrachochytrium salamandrivorans]
MSVSEAVIAAGGTYPCKPQACAVQACLVKNSFNANSCVDKTKAFEKCCLSAFKEQLPGAETACCWHFQVD